ncbi:MAG: hypothetical protein ACOY3I_01540 [Verrucomicrobiota bacterium]
MSTKLIKVLLGVSILLSLTALVLGFLIYQQKGRYEAQLTAVEQSLKEAPPFIQYTGQFQRDVSEPAATIQKANHILKNTQQELSEKTVNLDEAQKKVETLLDEKGKLEMDLTVAYKERETFEGQLTETKAKLESFQEELQLLQDGLRGHTPQELFSKIDHLESNIQALERQARDLGDKAAELQSQIEEMQTAKVRQNVPGEISGKVVAINKPWSFVVLDIGKNDNLAEGIELNVTREDRMIGKVRTVSVDATTAVADILPDMLKDEIQVGDQVAYIP